MEVGVIIGRFQVDTLHEGHRALINQAFSNHRRVIILVGCSPIVGTKHDPLDYPTRLRMLQAEYPDAIIHPLPDNQSDIAWSKCVDDLVRLTVPNVSKAVIYGGRDSFHKHYSGAFSAVVIDTGINYQSGTEQRQNIGKVVRNSSDFRAGIIYSTQNSWPYSKSCVDIAVIKRVNGLEPAVLLGKKENEQKWRLPGGMVEKNQSLEEAAQRELKEETAIVVDVASLTYVTSTPISDWRFKHAGEIGLVTALFCVNVDEGTHAKAGDDLVEIKWCPLINAVDEVMNGHKPLILAAKRKYNV